MDPDAIRSLRSWIRMNLLPHCDGGSMIPVDLSANCEGWIYDPNGFRIQIHGIRSRDSFSGSTDMSGYNVIEWLVKRPSAARAYFKGSVPLVISIGNQKFGIPRKSQNQIGIWFFDSKFVGIFLIFYRHFENVQC